MAGISRRDAAAAALIAIVIGLAAASPALERLRGLSLDILTALRWRAFGAAHAPGASHAVVVAIDEETYRTPPFAGTPNVTWTREIGRVLTAVVDGGAKVVGFDIVFPTSIEQSSIPFGEETLGARVRGFDRDFLRGPTVPAPARSCSAKFSTRSQSCPRRASASRSAISATSARSTCTAIPTR